VKRVAAARSAAPLSLRNRLLDPNRAVVSDDLSQGRLDDAAANILRPDSEGRPACHSNDHLVFADLQQLNAARVLLKERIENVVDDSLHRLEHLPSMRNCCPGRKPPGYAAPMQS